MSGERDLLRSMRFSGRYIGDLDLGEVQVNYRVTTKPVPESNPSQSPDRPILICLSKNTSTIKLVRFVASNFRLSDYVAQICSTNFMFVCLLKPRECPQNLTIYIRNILHENSTMFYRSEVCDFPYFKTLNSVEKNGRSNG